MKIMLMTQMSTRTARRSFGEEEANGFGQKIHTYNERFSFWKDTIDSCTDEYKNDPRKMMNKKLIKFRIGHAANDLHEINNTDLKNGMINNPEYYRRQIEVNNLLLDSQNTLKLAKRNRAIKNAVPAVTKSTSNGFFSKAKSIIKQILKAK